MGVWDDLTKMLMRAHPQDFVSLLLKDTQYLEDITNELKVRSVEADFLCKAKRNNQEIIMHVEFQKRKDTNMGLRVWEYNCVTTYLEKLPVCSFVIYLVKGGTITKPPFRIELEDGEVIHTFQYTNIFLWETPPDVLMQEGMEGMLPLLPLTKGADIARDSLVNDMINGLRRSDKEDVLALGYACASLIYETEGDQQWLKRRFAMFQDTLEDSWFYKEVIQKGIDIGQEKGEVKALRPVLIRVVETRFPELLSLARQEAERITVPAVLSALVDRLLVARTIEEARQALQEH